MDIVKSYQKAEIRYHVTAMVGSSSLFVVAPKIISVFSVSRDESGKQLKVETRGSPFLRVKCEPSHNLTAGGIASS